MFETDRRDEYIFYADISIIMDQRIVKYGSAPRRFLIKWKDLHDA